MAYKFDNDEDGVQEKVSGLKIRDWLTHVILPPAICCLLFVVWSTLLIWVFYTLLSIKSSKF